MPQSYCCLLYHVTFSTKEREPWLGEDTHARVHQYMAAGIRDEGSAPILINGPADHVHILAKLRQDKAVSEVLRSIEANSSGWIHSEFPNCAGFHWQNGYGAFTVSQSQADRVREYVAGQREHHRGCRSRMSFWRCSGGTESSTTSGTSGSSTPYPQGENIRAAKPRDFTGPLLDNLPSMM